MAHSKQSKDTLSRVARQFFKELKANYRLLSNLSKIVVYCMKLFEGQGQLMMSSQATCLASGGQNKPVAAAVGPLQVDQQINQSFIQFMFMNFCDSLVEEHQKYVFTLVRNKNYGVPEHVDKFKCEMLRFNHFSAILAHIDFEHCKYFAVRALRDIQR